MATPRSESLKLIWTIKRVAIDIQPIPTPVSPKAAENVVNAVVDEKPRASKLPAAKKTPRLRPPFFS